MLKITVPPQELWNSETDEFVRRPGFTLQMEHSLVSVSKWEAIWKKPFLDTSAKTNAEVISYVRCMTLTQNVSADVYQQLSQKNLQEINAYIDDPRTATVIKQLDSTPSSEFVTSELIYYWMIAQQIPFECQKWHLNRLITLVKVCTEKNKKQKPQNKAEELQSRAALNAKRLAKYNTTG